MESQWQGTVCYEPRWQGETEQSFERQRRRKTGQGIALVLQKEVLLNEGDDVTGYAMALLGDVVQRLRGEMRSYGIAWRR